MIPEGCRPDPGLGSVGRTRAFFATRSIGPVIYRQRLMRPEPHSRHSSQHPAPSWFSARRSATLRAAQLHIRHIVPWPALRASSELVLPSTSRPAQQTCPSACPCPGSSPITRRVASPITHTSARSESARLSALRGGRCRFVMRSAEFPRQQTCDDRLGCVGTLTAAGLCSRVLWRLPTLR